MFSRAQLDTAAVAQPSRRRVAAASRCEDSRLGLDSRGGTPPELAGEDARATISPGDDGGGVKLRPVQPQAVNNTGDSTIGTLNL